jgi:hypothetical protein
MARLIKEGDERGFELIEPDKHRSKYPLETVKRFEQWIIKDCELVIQNPLKNYMIYERDRMCKVVMGEDNHPINIQKMFLMSSYQELHFYMIDYYPGMVLDYNIVLFSESSLRKLMPKHIKKVGERYKQMCGCQTCIIFEDMYSCVKIWRKRYIVRHQAEIDSMSHQSRNKTTRQSALYDYISQVQKDGEIFPIRAWDAISDLACPKIEIDNGGELKAFHKFGCAISQCNQCP